MVTNNISHRPPVTPAPAGPSDAPAPKRASLPRRRTWPTRQPPILQGPSGHAAVQPPCPSAVSAASRVPPGETVMGEQAALRCTWHALARSEPLVNLMWLQPQERDLADVRALTAGDETFCTFQILAPQMATAAARLYPQASLPIPNLADRDEYDLLLGAVAYAVVDELEDVPASEYCRVHASARQITNSFFHWGDALVRGNGPEAQLAHGNFVEAWYRYAPVACAFEKKQAARLTREAELAPMRDLSTALRSTLYARLAPLLAEGNRMSIAGHVSNPDAIALFAALEPHWRVQVPQVNVPVEMPEFQRMLLCAYAPEVDYHVDYVAACAVARPLANVLERMVNYFDADNLKAANRAAKVFNDQWKMFVGHLGLYDASTQSRTLVLPHLDITLTEEQVRSYLQDEMFRPVTPRPWSTLWKVYSAAPETKQWEMALREALRVRDTSFTAAIRLVHQLRLHVEATDGKAMHALAQVLDVDPLHERQRRGEPLNAKVFYDICRQVMDHVQPEGWDPADLLPFTDFPVERLPDALVHTYVTVRAAQDMAWGRRRRFAAEVMEQAIAFERANFQDRLTKRAGMLPGTQFWLGSVHPTLLGTTLQERHAQAIADLLVNSAGLTPQTCPEILLPSLAILAPVATALDAVAVFGVAIHHFQALAHGHQISTTLASKLALQEALFCLPMDDPWVHERATKVVFTHLGECVPIAALEPMKEDMRNWCRPVTRAVRWEMIHRLTAAMRDKGFTDVTVTPWVRDIVKRGRALQRWAEVDLHVHDAYYADHLMPSAQR